LTIVVPGGEVYFLDKLPTKPAQGWAKRGILKKLGLAE
jgi:hypothetical protein